PRQLAGGQRRGSVRSGADALRFGDRLQRAHRRGRAAAGPARGMRMTRLLHALVLGLVGAGIVHIVVLLLVPAHSQRDAWTTLSQQSNYYSHTRLDPPGASPLIASIDPLFSAIAC